MPLEDFSVSVIIPAYNEEEGVARIVAEIREVGPNYEILVVDDGSKDNTAKAAQMAGASRVISHPYNIGNGAAVKTGARAATGDIIVMIDADGQHPVKNIPLLLEKMDQYSMAVGSRTAKSNVLMFRS